MSNVEQKQFWHSIIGIQLNKLAIWLEINVTAWSSYFNYFNLTDIKMFLLTKDEFYNALVVNNTLLAEPIFRLTLVHRYGCYGTFQ